jgi:8-oxo-dGTP pyrophosphatase MutT (NUDIX family)
LTADNLPEPLLKPLDALAARLQTYRPRRLPGRHRFARCGVVLLIAEKGPGDSDAAPALLMMRRAERAGDPWSGHVSFPGGRVGQGDASTRAAALRELQEETGISAADRILAMGRLSDLLTREHGRHRPMVVSPYVYRMPCAVALEPSLEAEKLWWEPLSTLVTRELRRPIIWRVAGLPLPLPSVDVSGSRLWGLSLMMVNELIRATDLQGLLAAPPHRAR